MTTLAPNEKRAVCASLHVIALVIRAGAALEFIWGCDYNFTNYNSETKIECHPSGKILC